MYIYGKLFLTHHGIMLDEVRSLLQKSLRRKDKEAVLSCLKELTFWGKDHLPRKSLVTFLFEDHCLCDENTLGHLYNVLYEKKRKDLFLLTLLKCPTSRIAACLPVVSLDRPYHCWSKPSGRKFQLVREEPSCFDVDLVLEGLLLAWTEKREKELMAYMKLAEMINEQEERVLTDKGKALVKNLKRVNKGKDTFGLLVIAFLHKHTTDPRLQNYLGNAFLFAPDCTRLVLSAVVTRRLHSEELVSLPSFHFENIEWDHVGPIMSMPDFAVDKHTFRGKGGICNVPEGVTLSEEERKEFFGKRQARGLEYFFEEGVIEASTATHNPYWDRTKHIYMCHNANERRTSQMTLRFRNHLKEEHSFLFHAAERELPLLQVPAYKGKVFVRVDFPQGRVVKGPYKKEKFLQSLYFHTVMREVLNDVHTLEAKDQYPFIVFPLIGKKEDVQVTRKEAKIFGQTQTVDLVTRGDLGITQVSNISDTIPIPRSFLMHFVYRYLLGIGDSSLVNAIWDGKDFYGIDMDEKRGKDGSCLLSCIFVKKPRQDLSRRVLDILKEEKGYFLQGIEELRSKTEEIQTRGEKHFDIKTWEKRIEQLVNLFCAV